jgi:hypothetical protein
MFIFCGIKLRIQLEFQYRTACVPRQFGETCSAGTQSARLQNLCSKYLPFSSVSLSCCYLGARDLQWWAPASPKHGTTHLRWTTRRKELQLGMFRKGPRQDNILSWVLSWYCVSANTKASDHWLDASNTVSGDTGGIRFNSAKSGTESHWIGWIGNVFNVTRESVVGSITKWPNNHAGCKGRFLQ